MPSAATVWLWVSLGKKPSLQSCHSIFQALRQFLSRSRVDIHRFNRRHVPPGTGLPTEMRAAFATTVGTKVRWRGRPNEKCMHWAKNSSRRQDSEEGFVMRRTRKNERGQTTAGHSPQKNQEGECTCVIEASGEKDWNGFAEACAVQRMPWRKRWTWKTVGF